MITPIEIRQHTFKKGLRGYEKEDVHGFLNTISMEWEKLLAEQKALKNELEKTQSNLEELRKVESALHKTLIQAEQTSKSTMENAKKDAELKVAEAENRSRMIVAEALDRKKQIEREVDALISQRAEVLNQLKMFLQSQEDRLKQFESNEMRTVSKPAETFTTPSAPPAEEESSFFDAEDSVVESPIVNDILDEL